MKQPRQVLESLPGLRFSYLNRMTNSKKVQTSNPGFFSKADVSTATTRRDKIQGKFYPLQHEEWLRAYKDLTDSQRGVLYYLRSLDPYSNGLRIRASKIAGDLGISRQTVYKAIDALEQKGYINKEDVEYTLKIQSKGFLCDSYSSGTQLSSESDSCKSEATAVSIERQLSSESDSCKSEATAVSVERQLSSETLTQQESQSSKINKTYTDFKKTLSEEERESFEKFVREEYFRTEGKKIRSFSAFMSDDHFQEWYQKYQNRPEAVQASQNAKWENHPRRDEWLAEIERTGNPAMFAGSDKEKQAFVTWCWDASQFSWLKDEGNTNGI